MRGSPITSRAPGDVARRRRPARATVRAGRDESIANNQSIVQKSSDGLRATRAREASVARVGRAPRGDAWRRVRSHTSRAGASARRRVARAPALDAPVRDARRRARLWIARDVRDWRARARRDRGRERPAWLRTRRRASPHARCADPIARRARARGRAVCAALRALYVPLCVSVCVCVRVPHSGCRARPRDATRVNYVRVRCEVEAGARARGTRWRAGATAPRTARREHEHRDVVHAV